MNALDPAAIYCQEAAELLESLEGTLLDLGQTPDDRTLVDAAFRALHTIKGSGAMFGFEDVAAFAHDFETAFDRVRQGEVAVADGLLSVALDAKDHIRALIERPETVDGAAGARILEALQAIVSGGAAPVVTAPADLPGGAAATAAAAGWRIGLRFAPHVLRNGTDPLGLLDELRALGPCTVTPQLDGLPDFTSLDPQDLHLGWEVVLEAPCPRTDIEDVFIFVLDDMVLELAPLAGREPAATAPIAGPAPILAAPAAVVAPVAAAPDHAEAPADRRDTGRRPDTNGSVRVQAERLDALWTASANS